MSKIFWTDTETTGLDPSENSMIELGGIIEIDGKIKEEVNLLFQPTPGKKIEQKALTVNKRTVKEIMGFPPATVGISSLKKTLGRYINKFDQKDKFVITGFNVNFDIGFIRETFACCGDKYYGSWFFSTPFDVWSIVAMMVCFNGLRLKNYKLTTICEHFNVKLKDAHTAINDVYATRGLCRVLLRKIEMAGFSEMFSTTMVTK